MTSSSSAAPSTHSDVILIGSGIMSANLGAMLKWLDPHLSIRVFEVTDELAQEASNGWNNAGTGHAGICEISYTPSRDADGRVNVGRALEIFEQFEHSKQFWSHAVASGMVGDPAGFIHAVPHIGFVHGTEDVSFLRARHAAMVTHHFFKPMEHTEDPSAIEAWAPLIMEGRGSEPVAATKMDSGTEVNFGELARRLLGWLAAQEDCEISPGHRVTSLHRDGGEWRVAVTNQTSDERMTHGAKFVFVGAGGGSLPLLQTTGLAEVAGLAGFPIGGQWLVCDRPQICNRHSSKVYGATPPSSPSLGAPHLDVRRFNSHRQLMFGPFALWTTRFLKHTGHWTDLPRSVRADNLTTLIRSAVHNRSLVQDLLKFALQNVEDRMVALQDYYPAARTDDWRLVEAGIRVQTIKKADRGAVYFGTEVFHAANGTLAALLGASPGASVSVNIALEVIRTCLPHLLRSAEGHSRMKQMIPTYNEDLKQPCNAGLFEKTSTHATETLQLN